MTDLEGRTALVTGSTSGIGRATALALAARGAHVLVVGRNEARAEQVVAEIEGGRPGPTWVLDACLDTAPFGDESAWSFSPTAGDIHGERYLAPQRSQQVLGAVDPTDRNIVKAAHAVRSRQIRFGHVRYTTAWLNIGGYAFCGDPHGL